ncbi:hypothetical protein [Xanthobacter autotrophicus]|uniref:hypothetical protein n=1 Tax=Xanthobacter autotrophicus TaxID=280 RepID=UPI003729ED8C
MAARVRIKAGPVEFEYEGETELAVADIKDLFSHIETLFKVPVLAEGGDGHAPVSQAHAAEQPKPRTNGPTQMLHVNSIATNLKGKSATGLAIAAAAALQIFEKKQTFTRAELLDTMKKANLHYKDSMSSNLTKTLGTLVGSKFNQVSDGVYSLTADAFQDLESQLA